MTDLTTLRGTGVLFFLSHHPWIAVVLIAVVIAVLYFQNQKRR